MASIDVGTYADLRSALMDTAIDEINLTSNITYTASLGVTVAKSDRSVVINGQGYSITDNNTASAAYLIIVPNTAVTSGFSLTFKNMRFYGRAYYGVAYIVEGTNNQSTTLTLDTVYYDGPQMVHNRSGTTIIKDSEIYIGQYNETVCPTNECVETRVLEFQGQVKIDTQAPTSISCFWMVSSTASLTVAANASVTITATTYMIYADGGTVATVFGANSVTSISTYNGMYYNAAASLHTSSTVTLEENASLIITQQIRKAGVGALRFRSGLNMANGSSLNIRVPATGTSALLQAGTGANITFNNPKSVVLYNYGANIFDFTGTPHTVTFDTELMNFWQTASAQPAAGGLDDPPLRAWSLASGSNINASAVTTASAMTSVSTNVTLSDPGGEMTTSTLNLFSCQALSMGQYELSDIRINDSGELTGTTEPSASIRAVFSETANVSADDSGNINEILLPAPVKAETVNVFSNINFLTKSIAVETEASLVMITDVSGTIQFKTMTSPSYNDYIKRADDSSFIQITDNRQSGAEWYLYAQVTGQMQSPDSTLDSILIYKNETDITLTQTRELVYTGMWQSQGYVTNLTWAELEGILLKPDSSVINPSGDYSVEIIWTIEY